MLSCAPYGYRYVKKTEHSEGFWEIDPVQAEVVREVFARYVEGDVSIGELARWLTARGIPTRMGKAVWDRSSVWAMLRNTAYRGQAAFGKTKTLERHGKPTRTTRARGERHGRRPAREDQPAENWTLIAVPAIVTEETFELAQALLAQNAHFAKRNTKRPTLLQGILVCRECGYGCYRTTTRTTNKRIYYYRCIGSDNYRHLGGRVCDSRPIRADELDRLVWGEVRRLLQDARVEHARAVGWSVNCCRSYRGRLMRLGSPGSVVDAGGSDLPDLIRAAPARCRLLVRLAAVWFCSGRCERW